MINEFTVKHLILVDRSITVKHSIYYVILA